MCVVRRVSLQHVTELRQQYIYTNIHIDICVRTLSRPLKEVVNIGQKEKEEVNYIYFPKNKKI